jgi:hypothetical protein
VVLAVAGTAAALLAGDARGVAWPAPTRQFGRRVVEGAAVVGAAGLVGVGAAAVAPAPGVVAPAAVAAGAGGAAGGTLLGRRWEAAATRGRAFLPAEPRGLVADGGNSPSSEPTDAATESRKLRRVVDDGAGSLSRNLFHGFWEVMILALPAHLYVLAFLGNPVAERTAATFAYPAAIAAAGVLRGGHVSVGAEWPDHLGWGVPARLVAYNLALALGIDLGIVAIVGVHWVVGAAVATAVPVVLVASVPYLAALGDRLARD